MCAVYMRLLWIGSCSQLCADKSPLTGLHCFNSAVVRNIFTSRSAFRSVRRYFFPIHQQSLIIYHFRCQWEANYAGRTIQRLKVGIAWLYT